MSGEMSQNSSDLKMAASSCGTDSTEFNEKITTLRDRIKAKKQTVAENLEKVDTYCTNTVEEIRRFRKDIEEYVAKMEENLLNECQKRREEATESMKDLERECASVEDELESMHVPKLTADGIVESPKAAQMKLEQLENRIAEINTKNNVNPHVLSRRQMLNEMIAKEIPIGEIREIAKRADVESGDDDKRTFDNLRLERTGQIRVRLISDERSCWITGMTCLKNNRLACADHNNKSVKLVDVIRGTVTNRVTFEHSPRDIAAIYDYQLAVTMTLENKIEILLQDSLTKSYGIKVDGLCSGIAHKDRLLYVSYLDPPKVEVLYLEGQVWQRFTKDNFGVHMFRTPRYLDVAMGDDYEEYVTVTDWRTNSIRKIKLDVRKHRDDNGGGYNGVVVLADESLLVCAENHRLYHVTSDLKRSRIVLNDIDDQIAHPDAICLNTETNTLFLSNRLPGFHSDNIFMYKLNK